MSRAAATTGRCPAVAARTNCGAPNRMKVSFYSFRTVCFRPRGGGTVKVMTILGTRPEIIRLALVIERLDDFADHVLVHTGQNYNSLLSDIFFREMRIRRPDVHLSTQAPTFAGQVAKMLVELEDVLTQYEPDRVLILGDTNTALAAAITASRLHIPVFHMEAGNRCFDRDVPEELNRKMIDAIADFNLPYTVSSRENLLAEGIPRNRIGVSGNPIYEVLENYADDIRESDILKRLQLRPQSYLLATVHRAENVDNVLRLQNIFHALQDIAAEFGLPIICSIHPHTRIRLNQYAMNLRHSLLHVHEPFGFFDFVHLEQNAAVVLTDSGTVQEEACIFRVPAVTMRVTTERPETVVCGSNTLAGVQRESIVMGTRLAFDKPRNWDCPEGYEESDVSWKVVNLVLGGKIHV